MIHRGKLAARSATTDQQSVGERDCESKRAQLDVICVANTKSNNPPAGAHTHTHTRTRARAHARTHTRTRTHKHTHTHTYTHTHKHTHTQTYTTHTYTHTHTNIHTHTFKSWCTCVYTHISVWKHTWELPKPAHISWLWFESIAAQQEWEVEHIFTLVSAQEFSCMQEH